MILGVVEALLGGMVDYVGISGEGWKGRAVYGARERWRV